MLRLILLQEGNNTTWIMKAYFSRGTFFLPQNELGIPQQPKSIFWRKQGLER
jgi:hypothetical protein